MVADTNWESDAEASDAEHYFEEEEEEKEEEEEQQQQQQQQQMHALAEVEPLAATSG